MVELSQLIIAVLNWILDLPVVINKTNTSQISKYNDCPVNNGPAFDSSESCLYCYCYSYCCHFDVVGCLFFVCIFFGDFFLLFIYLFSRSVKLRIS